MNEQPDDYIITQRKPEPVMIRRDEQLALIPTPDLRIEMKVLPSWNDYLKVSEHKKASQNLMKKWRSIGEEKAVWFARRAGFKIDEIKTHVSDGKGRMKEKITEVVAASDCFQRCEMVLRYWRPTWTTYDATNPLVKPIIDGFADSGLLYKDSQEFLYRYTVEFMGVDARLSLSQEAQENRKLLIRLGRGYKPMQARWWFDLYRK